MISSKKKAKILLDLSSGLYATVMSTHKQAFGSCRHANAADLLWICFGKKRMKEREKSENEIRQKMRWLLPSPQSISPPTASSRCEPMISVFNERPADERSRRNGAQKLKTSSKTSSEEVSDEVWRSLAIFELSLPPWCLCRRYRTSRAIALFALRLYKCFCSHFCPGHLATFVACTCLLNASVLAGLHATVSLFFLKIILVSKNNLDFKK